MNDKGMDKEADTMEGFDRGEDIAVMEPLQISDGSPHQGALTELAVDLAAKSAGFRRSLPDSVMNALAEVVAVRPR